MWCFLLHNWCGIKANQILEIDNSISHDLIRRNTVKEIKDKEKKAIRKLAVTEIPKEQEDRKFVYLLHDWCGIKAGQTFIMDSGYVVEEVKKGMVKEVEGKNRKVVAKEVSAITEGRKDKMIKKINVNTKDDVIKDG